MISRSQADELAPKPYELVSFPRQKPTLRHPAGHDQYRSDCYHGTLSLTLNVKTAVHVSTGIVVLGTDVKSKVPLIKTMTQGAQQRLTIAGSSLKGVVRSIYEAITNSTLAVVTGKYNQDMPRERLPCRDKTRLCPASMVFGALDWQGLVQFSDAVCQRSEFATGFMMSPYSPQPKKHAEYFHNGQAAGRKFYYHAVKALDGGEQGIPVQQAGSEYTFTTQVRFMNLTEAELGTLLIALGQDEKAGFALKVGGGKPRGMGTMTVTVSSIESFQTVRDRYRAYMLPNATTLTDQPLKAFIQQRIAAAYRHKLVETVQLKELSEILKFPTDRPAPKEAY